MTEQTNHKDHPKAPSIADRLRHRMHRLQDPSVFVPACVLFAVVVFVSIAGVLFLVFAPKPETSTRYNPSTLGIDNLPADPPRFSEIGTIRVEMESTPEIAFDTVGSRLLVAGDRKVVYFNEGADGATPLIELPGEPQCIAVGTSGHRFPGRIYVAVGDHVVVYNANGELVAEWPAPIGDSVTKTPYIASIAVGPETVFVADRANGVVHLFNTEGEQQGAAIEGVPEEDGQVRAFFLPTGNNPNFEIDYSDLDGLLRVVDRGRHTIEAFTEKGRWEAPLAWGTEGNGVEDFVGCCNPTAIDRLPDGRFVTAEKFILRVKLYSATGEYEGLVAAPESFELPQGRPFQPSYNRPHRDLKLTVDGDGRVLVLDPEMQLVHIFEEIAPVEKVDASDAAPDSAYQSVHAPPTLV